MLKKEIRINHIPAILWGEDSERLFIAVHGNMSSKSDIPISILAEEVVPLGYQVLSFDLPEHGDRKNESTLCKVETCIQELAKIMDFGSARAKYISLFACSMGVYFSLLAYKDSCLEQSLFLSPVVNMERIINNMMTWFNITEEQLKREEEILTPIGQMLYWDYYRYVKENPILCWSSPTSIIYGEKDELCEFEVITDFVKNFGCELEVVYGAQHYFHTSEQLIYYRQWLKKHLILNN
ncbi:alpha/beta hydrolase [Sporanaerobium hydrogeniformans]|uniref:Alpha/beta hydrolase n=1 Tax=Sporanaerobium hydrogeniformans TaxID=3072179 RepID=A0AC61D958_9FIRM|nr:alpha/beta hydrolase [Sporanaerobium hydrogeniformans]PHV69320.1 alpha/beta hydrolase [Sporanaerobium hydrogeniformans]